VPQRTFIAQSMRFLPAGPAVRRRQNFDGSRTRPDSHWVGRPHRRSLERGRVSGSVPDVRFVARPRFRHDSQLVAAATPPAGVDEDEDNDENSEGDEPSADPEHLARKSHVLTSFAYQYGGGGAAVVKGC
jgi:hypothetical protein